MSQFKTTRNIIGYNFAGLQAGQWVRVDQARGQYLGTTRAGAHVIRWQQADSDKFSMRDAKANKPLRQYAKLYAAK